MKSLWASAQAYFKMKFQKPYLMSKGFCCICESNSTFQSKTTWLRDNFLCNRCGSIPRQRAIINTLNIFYPNWANCTLHESSGCGPATEMLKRKCSQFGLSYFFPNIELGTMHNGARCEDLENLTFPDSSIDIFITQDVMEHVFDPIKVFREVERVLKPGGAYIFSVPWYRTLEKTKTRAILKKDRIEHLVPPNYHGNPISSDGCLVTFDWGLDICEIIASSTNLRPQIYLEQDIGKGLKAEFLEIFICSKEN